MVAHHGLLEALLTVFKGELKTDAERAWETLAAFRWEEEKHIFTEEKAIFGFCEREAPELCQLVKRLEEEHTVMLEMMDDLRDDLVAKAELDVEKFQEFMIRHRQTEEKELYPELDRVLKPEVKKEIIARINEIPMKK